MAKIASPPPFLTVRQFLMLVIRPGLAMLDEAKRGPAAECMMLAIALQETGLRYLYQVDGDGRPLLKLARGFWQFEKGGVRGVLTHPSTAWLRDMLARHGMPGATVDQLHLALPASSLLQAWCARANLWWFHDPLPQPAAEGQHEGWMQYLAIWGPGKPRPLEWHGNWAAAVTAVAEPGQDALVA